MPANFSGKWVSSSSEGWKEFLTKFKVPVESLPADIKLTEEITQSGDQITIKISNNKDSKVREVVINVGSNHKDQVVPGVELEFTTSWEGDKLVMKKVDGAGGMTRELVGGQMLVTLDGDGVIAKTFYDKA